MNFRQLISPLVLVAPALVCAPSFAQVFDDVELRREGADAVAHLRFVNAVQFQRSVAARAGDLVQIFYNLSPSVERPADGVGERRIVGGNGLPSMFIRDEALVRSDPFKRRMLIEFSVPANFTVRAGRRKETIDIVFEGKAEALPPTPVGGAAPRDGFIVILQSSPDAQTPLGNSIPAALQDKDVFTARRTAGAQTVYDFNLGYFPTREAADQAQKLLSRRFPQAQVAAVGSASGVPAPEARLQTAGALASAAAASLPAAPASAAAPGPAPKGFAIRLQSSPDPRLQLQASIPAMLQGKDVFTGQRLVDGKPAYDISLGYFADESEAQRMQQLLSKRFAQAEVVAVEPTPIATVAQTQPGAPLAAATDVATAAAAPVVVAAQPGVTAPSVPVPAPVAKPTPVAIPVPAPVQVPVPVAEAPTATPAPISADAAPAVAATAVAPPAASVLSTPEIEARATELMVQTDAANDRGDYAAAIGSLDALLNLPPNAQTRKAQEQIGMTRLKAGDRSRARAEFETFLKLYRQGADSDLVRQFLQNLPADAVVAQARKGPEPVSILSGSVSMFYYGGESKVQSQDLADSPLGGLVAQASAPELTNKDQSQIQTNIDVNWRYRDADRDQRFVLRQNYSQDLLPNRPNRERLSALYYEQRDFSPGTSFKVGRQSPTGAGVLYRFDGVQLGYRFAPKWRVNATYGVPTDPLLDASRMFYGLSVDAEALTTHSSGTVFLNQQTIDGEIDRSAVGAELRYFNEGLVLSGQLDYDQMLQGLNVMSLQGSWQSQNNTVVSFLLDRRATPIRTLGNVLFYQTSQPFSRTISQLLNTVETDGSITPIDILRNRVNTITSYQSQAMAGVTVPINDKWQTGANINYTSVDEILPFKLNEFDFAGQPATGDLWSTGVQLIGSNLYSGRDTHVFSINYLTGPTYQGQMFAYNNLTGFDNWQLEPSIRYYTQTDSTGTKIDRWTPGVRMSYRAIKRVTLESDFSYEIAETSSPTRTESAKRMFYYLGGRFDF